MMPWVARVALRDPGYLLCFVGLVGLADAVCVVVLAYAPKVAVAIAMHTLVAASIGTLAPVFFALLSLVTPSRVRSAGLTTIAVVAIPGVAVFLLLIGVISDAYGIRVSLGRAPRPGAPLRLAKLPL